MVSLRLTHEEALAQSHLLFCLVACPDPLVLSSQFSLIQHSDLIQIRGEFDLAAYQSRVDGIIIRIEADQGPGSRPHRYPPPSHWWCQRQWQHCLPVRVYKLSRRAARRLASSVGEGQPVLELSIEIHW